MSALENIQAVSRIIIDQRQLRRSASAEHVTLTAPACVAIAGKLVLPPQKRLLTQVAQRIG
jgi:hypothetical protein